MSNYVSQNGIQIAQELFDFVNDRALPGTGVARAKFWNEFADLLGHFAPRNAELLAKREDIQAQIDAWHIEHKDQPIAQTEYQAFLKSIGYLVEEPRMLIRKSRPWPDRSWWYLRSMTVLF